MYNELHCPEHGPYDASYGECPYCAQPSSVGRPRAPQQLNLDDGAETVLPSAIGTSQGSANGGDGETHIPRAYKGDGYESEGATQLPVRQRQGEDELGRTRIKAKEDTGLLGWLIVKKSPCMTRGNVHRIKPGMIIGRDIRSATLILDDDFVSDLHTRLQMQDDHFTVFDLGSTNGTFVNGEKVTTPIALKQDDEISISDTIFVLKTLQ